MVGVWLQNFCVTKVVTWIYKTDVLMNAYPLHHSVFFCSLLLCFHFKNAYIKKGRKLANWCDKLVGKALINLLWHAMLATSAYLCTEHTKVSMHLLSLMPIVSS